MGGTRLKIKETLHYRRGGTAHHCGCCDFFVPDFKVRAIGGGLLKKAPRCRKIGLENSILYQVNYNGICDAYDNTEALHRLGVEKKKGGGKLVAQTEERKITYVDPEGLEDNPFQPRHYYNPKDIDELAASIEIHGMRQIPEAREQDGKTQVAFGHKRKRAYIKLKKKDPKKWGVMPLEIKEISDHEMFYFAMEENLRRGDITPIDTARGIDHFLTVFPSVKEQEVANKLKMTQGNVSNMRRVLRLPKEILDKVDEGKINFTMARELLIFQDITGEAGVEGKWSRKEQQTVSVPKDAKYFMLEAVRGVTGQYGHPCTVDGIIKSIASVAERHLQLLEKSQSPYGYHNDPLFDTQAAGCLKCRHCITVHPTKSLSRHYCWNPECWEEKQQSHKDEAARAAKQKMAKDVLSKIGGVEGPGSAGEDITQEISGAAAPESTFSPEDLEISEEDVKRRPGFELCRDCLNATKCDGTGVYTDESDHEICDARVTKETLSKVTSQAIIEIPEHLKGEAAAAAGTRAEILDLDQLRLGPYNSELKAGHVYLAADMMRRMADPGECTKRCTTGFHYAFDSRHPTDKVAFVCTNPKCCSKKKAAFTRAQNEQGHARKKAELKAIQEAVGQTTYIDKARLKLIILLNLKRQRTYYGYGSNRGFDPVEYWSKKLAIDLDKVKHDANQFVNVIIGVIDRHDEQTIAKLIVEAMLEQLRWDGDVSDYKIQTTEPLNWMGVTPKLKRPGTETENQDKKK